MLNYIDEEERKKREEEFDRMFGNNTISNTDYELRANEFDSVFGGNNTDYETRAREFDEMFGIKEEPTIETIEEPSLAEKMNDVWNDKTRQKEYDNSKEENNIQENINEEEIKKKINEESKKFKNTATVNPETKNDIQPINAENTKMRLASEEETKGLNAISPEKAFRELKLNEEVKKRNEAIQKGGTDAVNDWITTVLTNIYGGFKQSVSGLANVVTTLAGLGVKGLSNASGIIGMTEQEDSLNNAYNDIVEEGSKINEIANYEMNVTNRLDNDFIKTSGEVTNIISNMVGNTVIGYATGGSGTVIQGLSVGGSSAQQVLDENKDNIGQATITGLAKGYTSYLTERMFDANLLTRGEGSSISNAVDRIISNRINSKFGKEFANRLVGIVGENLEELVEDNIDNIIDRTINNKETPDAFSEEWWRNTTETAKATTISTIIMNLLGIGGESFENKEKDIMAEHWINEAQNIIEQEDRAIHFNPEEVKTAKDVKEFYVTRFNSDGDIESIKPTIGKQIYNQNHNLNIVPIIIKDNQTGSYNVIDGNTGIVLDSTPYSTTIEAQEEFNNKVSNLSELQIKDINQKVDKANYVITDNIMSAITTAQEQINQKTFNNIDTENENTAQTSENQNTDNFNTEMQNNTTEINNNAKNENGKQQEIKKSFEDIALEAMDNFNEDEVENIESPLKNRDIETIGKQQNVKAYQYENPKVKPYFQEMAKMIGEDLGYVSSSDNRSTKKGGGTELGITTKALDILHNEQGYSYDQIAQGLNNIIDDNGKENNAVSKKLEIIIDDQLRNGYVNSLGKYIEPNQEYINTVKSEQGQVDIEKNEIKQKASKANIIDIVIDNKNYGKGVLLKTKLFENTKPRDWGKILKEYVFNNLEGKQIFNSIENGKNKAIYIAKKNDRVKKDGAKNSHKVLDKLISTKMSNNIRNLCIEQIENIMEISKTVDTNNENSHQWLDENGWEFRKALVKDEYNNVYEVLLNVALGRDRNVLYDINNIKKIDHGNASSKRDNSKKSISNNSIPQKIETVKNGKTIINNKSMQNKENNTNIQDFGEKIGGARKDLSSPRTTIKQDKEVIHDYTVNNKENGYTVNFKGKVLKEGFKSQEEAEKYILDFKNNIKSNLAFVEEGSTRDGEKRYTIYLRNPRTLRSQYIGKTFSNKQDAENYAMALSMYLKENGKNLFRPQIQKVERINANSKNATKATGDNILNNFGFKGGEFGNWVTQNERQQFLNYAQDAFTDLATALDITPDSLGQNGTMSIAFGARGQGLTGAVAHFEPVKKVINMTRLKGAGSLAHEYGHSIDNYLSRYGGYDENGMATTNMRNPKLSENMKNAIKQVEDAMKYNVSTNQEEIDKKNSIYEKHRRENVEYNLQYIDKVFSGKATKYKRIKGKYETVPIEVTAKQKSDYQKIRNVLINGELQGEIDYQINKQTLKTEKTYPEPINKLQQIYKEVVGRKLDDDTVYSLYRQGKPAMQVTEVKSESAYSKSALELDKATGRTSTYFSRIDEMWARAFESYVSDKLKAKGITDTYLVHSVNNNEYALFNPFPAGEERKNINKAFDNLIQVMKDEGLFTSSGTPQNYDEDTGIRYMKKSNTKTPATQKVTDNKGRELSKQQQEYFKDSLVRDEKGNLETVYHGTLNYGFTKFDGGHWGANYYTNSKNVAESYFIKSSNNNGVYEGYLNIKKPLEIDMQKRNWSEIRRDFINDKEILDLIDQDLGNHYEIFSTTDVIIAAKKSREYDGVIFKNIYDDASSKKINLGNDYVTFNSNQFKNIDNKNPTSNEDIRFAKRKAKTADDNLRNAERAESYIEQEIQKIEKTGNWDDSIPVTKLTDIRKTIEDYLGLRVKKGHFRQAAYALYKGNRDVIRTKEYKDMDSILHETGHALDLGNRLKVDKESISNELLTAVDKMGGYEEESRTIRLDEGFAEVIREYSIVPNQAKSDYPQTVAVIEKIRQNDKSFNNFITKVQQQTYNYIHQNPRNRVLSNQSIGEQTDRTPLSKAWLKQEVMRNIYDKDYIVKSAVSEMQKAKGKTVNQLKASDNAYILTRLSSGITDKVTSMLANGYIDEEGKKLMPGLNEIGEILENDPKRFDDLRSYLVARRDTDYKAKTLKTGIRSMDSKAVIEQFKNDTQIQKAAKLVYDTLDGVMQYAVNNGLISQETANNLKESNAFYVPMQRVIDNRGNQVGRKGAISDILKKRTGSELDIKDVLENIIANSSNIIQQVENNNILKALYNQGEESGLTGTVYDIIDTPMTKIGTAKLSTWEAELKKQGVNTADLDLEKTIDLFAPNNKVDSKNLITSFIDDSGKRVYLQFNDEILFNSLMNMDKKFMSQVLKINAKMNMPLRYGATMANIGFAIPNMISDTAQATIYSTAGFIPVVDNALGVLDILASTNKTVRNFVNQVAPGYADKINKLYTIYQQTGATSSTRLSQYRESTQNLMKDVYGVKKSKNLGVHEKFKPLKRLLDIMTYIPELSEQSTRFEVFKKNYEYYTKKGNSEMDSRILAALESRDATQDFGRTGNITREINQLIPFSAARVGSAYTFAEKVKANPKQVGMRIAVLTALALGIKAMGNDDDEIDELNQRKKDDNFVFKVGDQVVTIKKPQGILRSIINLAEYIQDLATGHIEEGKEAERLGEWLNNAIMDNMPADEITGLVPNAVAPLIENAINKDFYYNTDIVKNYDLELPDSEQYYDYNSQLAILLGKVFNYSPAKIDNLISGYFGGLGSSVSGVMDYMMGKLGMIPEKPEMGAEQGAVGKRFFVNVNTNSSSIDEIYNRKTELTKSKNGGTITEEETKELEQITNATKSMSNINKQIKEIKASLTMSGTEKAEKIRELQEQKTDIARQALGKNLIHTENESKIQSTQFYPTNSTLSKNRYKLELTSEMKKEYEQIASEYYSKYEKQGIYNEAKLDNLKSKAKDYAKNQLFQKYKANLVKSK